MGGAQRLAASILAVLAVGIASPAAAHRDDQWVFRREWGDGSSRTSAVFLSWDYSVVLFRATCDHARHELVLDYYGDGELPLSADMGLAVSGSSRAQFRTRLIDGRLEGRMNVNRATLRAFSGSRDLEIDAPNEMGEPWYVGKAAPLRRLARLCL